MSHFINDKILEAHEKINDRGHFTLYKNTKKINSLYKEKGSKFNYKDVFTREENYAFDEKTGINEIVRKNNIKTIIVPLIKK